METVVVGGGIAGVCCAQGLSRMSSDNHVILVADSEVLVEVSIGESCDNILVWTPCRTLDMLLCRCVHELYLNISCGCESESNLIGLICTL